MIAAADSPEWKNYYTGLEAKLLGRPALIHVGGEVTDPFPPPPDEEMARYGAIKSLLHGDDIAHVFALIKDRVDKEYDGIAAASATDYQLRAAKAKHEFLKWMANQLVAFVETMDYAAMERAKRLEAQKKPDTGEVQPPST